MTLGKMILKKKKAVSPVIATILLIALTVTAAAIVYFVVVPLLRAKPELVATDYGKASGYSDRYEIDLDNLGGADANIAGLTAFELTNTTDTYNPVQVYIGSTAVTFPYVITQGDSVSLVLDFDTVLTTGMSITLTITYDDGATLEVTDTI